MERELDILSAFEPEGDDQGIARWFYGGTPPPDAQALTYPFIPPQHGSTLASECPAVQV